MTDQAFGRVLAINLHFGNMIVLSISSVLIEKYLIRKNFCTKTIKISIIRTKGFFINFGNGDGATQGFGDNHQSP